MSRVGKMPIPMPDGVEVTIRDNVVTVKGPKGELTRTFSSRVKIEQRDGPIIVERLDEEQKTRALHGLTRTLIHNMVQGVSAGYERSLEVVGVGYRASQQGEKIALQVGFSRPVEVAPLPEIQLQVEGQNRIHVRGIEKERVGLMAARIRSVRPPDRYKGKGIRYLQEVIRLKAGKAGKRVK